VVPPQSASRVIPLPSRVMLARKIMLTHRTRLVVRLLYPIREEVISLGRFGWT
jgi:hypothetical protein